MSTPYIHAGKSSNIWPVEDAFFPLECFFCSVAPGQKCIHSWRFIQTSSLWGFLALTLRGSWNATHLGRIKHWTWMVMLRDFPDFPLIVAHCRSWCHISWPLLCGSKSLTHRENDGTLGMVPLIINPIYTLYSGYFLGTTIFPVIDILWLMFGCAGQRVQWAEIQEPIPKKDCFFVSSVLGFQKRRLHNFSLIKNMLEFSKKT